MLTSRRIALALCAAVLSLVIFAAAALATAGPTVTVRIEGLSETKLPATSATTSSEPVVKDGDPADSCPGTSALGALQTATEGNWSGPWNAEYEQYEIFSIENESHVFEPSSSANYYWSLWVNEKEATSGACEVALQSGDRVLFFPACYGNACPPSPLPLGVEAPSSANVGEKVSVAVKRYSTAGTASAAEGATVAGGAETVTTSSGGHATVSFSSPGQYTLRVSGPESVRTEASICVHAGNDGSCGTTASTGSSSTSTATASTPLAGAPFAAPYKGAFALVPSVKGVIEGHVYPAGAAPKVLSGTVLAHSAVSSVSLELRREYKGRCYAFDGTSERFVRARCGTGKPFKASNRGVFSYLLPAALAPGRYVLDVKATDAAGNSTTLARGSSRVVFYVR